MDQRPNVSLENTAKPSKLMALIALVIAFALPFILVKAFPHKQRTTDEKEQQLASPRVKKERAVALLNQEKLTSVKPRVVEAAKVSSDLAKQKTTSAVPALAKPQKLALSQAQAQTNSAATAKETTKPFQTAPATAPAKLVTAQVKSAEQDNGWKTLKTRNGDSFATVFNRMGISRQTLQIIMRDNTPNRSLLKLRPNQELQFLFKNKKLEKLIVPYSATQYLLIYKEGQHYRTKLNNHKTETHNHFVTATLRGSLYTTAKHHNIPYKLIQQMTEIFAWDINFAKDVRAGDQFTIVYQAYYVGDKLVGTGDIVAVSYKNRGKLFQAASHTTRTGRTDYFSPQGNSLKKAFNRYPLRFSHISSTFSLARNHPILRYKRPHKGVDLAAPIGTPILATGDGVIEIIGRQSGYGNMIKIKHDKTHSTIYGHMLKFQKGLSKGNHVKRGQVIGYVGQSGLATGPHCHYEFHINRQPKNPTTVALPRGESIPSREMANFRANTNNLLAQMRLFESGRLANANKRPVKLG